LDEPTAGLDPAQALAVADILRALARSGAVLFSTHDVALAARVADAIVLMRDGSVVAQGAPRDALTPQTLRDAYGREGRLQDVDGDVAFIFR
jgi:iron complex transport system ATP-binding protein